MNPRIVEKVIDTSCDKRYSTGTLCHTHDSMEYYEDTIQIDILDYISSIPYVRIHIIHRIDHPWENRNKGTNFKNQFVKSFSPHFRNIWKWATPLISTLLHEYLSHWFVTALLMLIMICGNRREIAVIYPPLTSEK